MKRMRRMNGKTRKLGSVVVAAAFLVGATVGTTLAAESAHPSLDLSVGLYSKYVWRGYELSKDSMVVQPSLTASYEGFGFNLWGNLDTDQSLDIYNEDGANWNETDMTVSYDGSYGMVGYTLGYIYYGLEGARDSQEFYGSISLDTLLSPTLTVYREFSNYPGWYTTLGISHSFALSDKISLDLGAQASYLVVDDASTLADPDNPGDAYSDFHDGLISAAVTIPVTQYVTVTPELYYSFALSNTASDVMKASSASGNDDNFLYGGVSIGFSY
ncbi:bacterial protein of unknown function [bacterium BMS3Bbin14]|nr:bacterial protein of unknown function [bacterium BMS3Abin13]GBE53785.1 bacterial protein of unknown function [bacterium BMS3Bbin14]